MFRNTDYKFNLPASSLNDGIYLFKGLYEDGRHELTKVQIIH